MVTSCFLILISIFSLLSFFFIIKLRKVVKTPHILNKTKFVSYRCNFVVTTKDCSEGCSLKRKDHEIPQYAKAGSFSLSFLRVLQQVHKADFFKYLCDFKLQHDRNTFNTSHKNGQNRHGEVFYRKGSQSL